MNVPKDNPWAKQAITIYLTPDRRGKLADYATGMNSRMTPAETIYALIDTASGHENEEAVSLSRVKVGMESLLNHINAQAAMIQDCSLALQGVSQALISIQNMMTNLAPAEGKD